jgi:hypothetical protein
MVSTLPKRGDLIRLTLKVDEDTSTIVEGRFEVGQYNEERNIWMLLLHDVQRKPAEKCPVCERWNVKGEHGHKEG